MTIISTVSSDNQANDDRLKCAILKIDSIEEDQRKYVPCHDDVGDGKANSGELREMKKKKKKIV